MARSLEDALSRQLPEWEVPHPRGGLAQPEGAGGLTVRKLLEVPEQDDLAVVLFQAGDGVVEPPKQLVTERLGGRRQVRVADLRR